MIDIKLPSVLYPRPHYPKTVITYDAFSGNTYAGIQMVSLEQFLWS